MSYEVDACARREALRVRGEPIPNSDIRLGQLLCALATNEQENGSEVSELLRTRVAHAKAKFYGHIGVSVAGAVWLTLDHRTDRGKYGLLHFDGDTMRNADANDVSSWLRLERSWEHTLAYAAHHAIDSGEESDGVLAAKNMWEARRRALNINYGLAEHMMRGCGTASRQMMIEAYRMNILLKRGQHAPSRNQRLDIMRGSPNPLISSAGLEVGQFHAFNFGYGGALSPMDSDNSTINFRKIDSTIIHCAGSGNVTNVMPIEQLSDRAAGCGEIGEVEPRTVGPRIGCPILLTPHLAQELWVAYVDSLALANFM